MAVGMRIGKGNTRKLVFWCIVYRLLLEVIYVAYLSKEFAYYGMTYEQPVFWRVIVTWLFFIAFLPWFDSLLDQTEHTVSNLALSYLFLVGFIPASVQFTYKPADFMILYYLYWLFIALWHRVIPAPRRRVIKSGNHIVSFLTYSSVLLALFVWIYYAKCHIQISIINVYGTRTNAKQFAMPTILSYLYAGINYVLPFLMIWALHKKNKKMVILTALALVVIFFTFAAKTVFFQLVLCIMLFFYLRKKEKRIFQVGFAFSGIVVLGMFEKQINGTTLLYDLIVRRVFFLPGTLNYYYYDFFSKNPVDYFRQSILRRIGLHSPYQEPIPNIISDIYYHNPTMVANNGWFSDAYMNLGVAGVFVMPLLVILLLKVFDMASEELPVALMIPIVLSLAVIYGGSFFTNLLTHGLIFLWIVVYLVPRVRKQSE